jgi:hypothetical protein
MKLSALKASDKNPRYIRDQAFEETIDSLLGFPEMLAVRGIVYVGKPSTKTPATIPGGNQRYRALMRICDMPDTERTTRIENIVERAKKRLTVSPEERQAFLVNLWTQVAATKEIPDEWTKDATGWTPEQIDEFAIKDNVWKGEWDTDALANEWEVEDLQEWGVNLPGFDSDAADYAGKNMEVDVDSFDSEMTINLKYSEEEYWQVKEGLSKIAQTPEAAVWKLLGNE